MAKRKHTHTKATVATSTCKKLILIDSSQIRLKEQKKCKDILCKLEKIKGVINQHENHCQPEYQRWFHPLFAKSVTDIQELENKVFEIHLIIDEVQEQCAFTGEDPGIAYEKINEFKSRSEKIKAEFEQSSEKVDDADSRTYEEKRDQVKDELKENYFLYMFESCFGTKKQWKNKKQTYEEAFAIFKADFSAHMQDMDLDDKAHRDKKHSKGKSTQSLAKKPIPDSSDLNLKEQYRTIARKLHPDLNPDLEPRKIELWHQVQQAYAHRDLSRLQTLAAMCDVFDESWINIGEVGTLQNLFKELRRSLQDFEKTTRQLRKELSWKFSEKIKDPSQLRALKKSIEKDLVAEYQELQDEHDELQKIVNFWTRKRGKKQKRN